MSRSAEILELVGDMPLDRLRELMLAERDGRLRVLYPPTGQVCGTCNHWKRRKGYCSGDCDVRPYSKSNYSLSRDAKILFHPQQSP